MICYRINKSIVEFPHLYRCENLLYQIYCSEIVVRINNEQIKYYFRYI
jgi:hypothetical protein